MCHNIVRILILDTRMRREAIIDVDIPDDIIYKKIDSEEVDKHLTVKNTPQLNNTRQGKLKRCKNGSRRNKKTKLCKKNNTVKSKLKRCSNGTRRNKKTKLCEKNSRI